MNSSYVLSIIEDSHGNFWFGTTSTGESTESNGVSKYNGKYFTHFTTNAGLSDNSIFSLQEESNRNIWVGTRKGLNQLESNPDSFSINNYRLFDSEEKTDSVKVAFNPLIRSFGFQDGLKGVDFKKNSVFLDSRNRIWWGTLSGLTMLDMNKYKASAEAPVSLQLNWIEINEQFIDFNNLNESPKVKIESNGAARFYNYPNNLKLPYFQNHITFHFLAIDWSAPHKILYSYKMEGLNNHWSSPTSEAKADYLSLPHGVFTFKVRSMGEAQIWSEPFEYTFTILPPWWHSWWARTGYILTAMLYIYALFRWRTARLKLRQKELVTDVRNATSEIRSQKQEVEAQRDEIEAQRNMVVT